MKSLVVFFVGLLVGVATVFTLTHRYDVQVATTTNVPLIIKVDRWTGKVTTEFAIPDSTPKK